MPEDVRRALGSDEELARVEEKWRELTDPARERLGPFQTVSGKEIKDLYTPRDVEGLDYLRDLGFPGTYPFTRGVQANMYRGRLWTMRQFSGFGDAADSNRR
ncbi:MAG: methylmalonyl-CoA mutase, partial [Firmicutes bacterium]|nr:methylmalonyl-CoA mutase [Bacillota bacterium]